jgi:hypothetical protein
MREMIEVTIQGWEIRLQSAKRSVDKNNEAEKEWLSQERE